MKIELKIKKEFDVKYLEAICNVRYWEDATVNNIEDVNGELIPCKKGDTWNPLIDIEKGIIVNWKEGVNANIHYKVCDEGVYLLKDSSMNIIVKLEDAYVVNMMCPKGSGYGDYVKMNVLSDGTIEGFVADFDDFNIED